MKMSRYSMILLFLLMLNTSCQMKKMPFDFGEIVQQEYKNNYFKFKMDIPSDWDAQADGALEWRIKNNYFDPETNEVEEVDADVRDVEDALLLVLVEQARDSFNLPGSVTIFAESLWYNEDVKSGEDYLKYSTEEIIQMGNFTILSEAYQEINLGGENFYMMDAQLDVDGRIIYQSFLSTTKQKFGLSAILTYAHPSLKQKMLEIMKTIKFYG